MTRSMVYRVYLRDPQQRVFEKTVTGDQTAALAAFTTLVNRVDLDDTPLLAVMNFNGRPVAHHLFALREDGSPLDPAKHWRGRCDDIVFPSLS